MNPVDRLHRDSLIFRHTCPGTIEFDASLGRYRFSYRTDDATFNKVENESRLAKLPFDNAAFNDFINGLRGYGVSEIEEWDSVLEEWELLPGEVVLFNFGYDNELALLKISAGRYMVVKAAKREMLLLNVATDGHQVFKPQEKAMFDVIGAYRVECIHLMPPPRVNRAFDFLKSQYAKNTVSQDISGTVRESLVALGNGEFEKEFPKLVKDFAIQGVSSYALRMLSDAYTGR